MRLYIKICLISSIIMLGVIGTYSFLFSHKTEDIMSVNGSDYKSEIKVVIDREERNYIALVCDSVCPEAPYLCKVAFCAVILNRCYDAAFPNTPAEVISSDPIFKDAMDIDYDNKPTDTALKAYDDALSGFSPCPDALYYYTAEATNITLKKRSTLFQMGKYIFS